MKYFAPSLDGQSQTVWGSSVVTETHGPSRLLHYITTKAPVINLDEKSLKIKNGACYVSDEEVGKPCSVTNTSDGFLTELQISSVTKHKQLVVSGHVSHTTFFAPNCVFPEALAGNT
nr:unnamed protein product [Spirometra erinaceieuropaei]